MKNRRDMTIREVYEEAGEEGGRIVTWKTTAIMSIACALILAGSFGGLGLVVEGYIGWGWASIATAVLSLAFLLWFRCWYMAKRKI